MPKLELFNHLAQVDLAGIDPAAVAELPEEAQQKLGVLIDKVSIREKASERYFAAIRNFAACVQAQTDALAAHVAANPAQTFIEAQRAVIAAQS